MSFLFVIEIGTFSFDEIICVTTPACRRGDIITRFSGITICSIMTGVIWVGQPESFMDVILYDNLHVLLWVGGLFFALRGNRT